MFSCVQELFNGEDYKSLIHKKDIIDHCTRDNAWILIGKHVYSLEKKDDTLLDVFKDYYGKDVYHYLLEKYSNKELILVLEKLKKRKIGIIH